MPSSAAGSPSPVWHAAPIPQTAIHKLRKKLLDADGTAASRDLVEKAELWPWGSLYVRSNGPDELIKILSKWPGGEPGGWLDYVNEPITPRELERPETSERRGRPYGEDR